MINHHPYITFHFSKNVFCVIRVWYVGMAHAAPPTQYKCFMAFSTNWLSEALLLDTPARSSRFHGHDHFPVIVSTVEVAEQSSITSSLLLEIIRGTQHKSFKNLKTNLIGTIKKKELKEWV